MKLRVFEQRNACGECTACCTVFGVAEVEKGFYSPCRHLNQGCGIYADRPTVCKDFLCGYAQGLLGSAEMRRPDRNGLMFQLLPSEVLQVWEVLPGGFEDIPRLTYLVSKVEAAVTRRSRERAVVLYPYGSSPGIGVVDMSRFERYLGWLVFNKAEG